MALSVLDGGPTFVPGLFGQIVVPTNSVVVFSGNGGIVNTGLPGDHVRVEIRLVVDGAEQDLAAYDVENGNFSTTGRWSFSVAVALPAGTHTVGVQALSGGIHRLNAASPWPRAMVGGAPDTNTRGTLTAVVLKQ